MDFSAIIYAALGGGIGGAMGSFIGKLFKKEGANNALVGVVAVIMIVTGYQGTIALYKNMKLPRIFPLDTKEMVKGLPALEYIQEQNPAAFKELIYPVDRAVRRNEITQKTLNEFRSTFFALLEQKKKSASIEVRKTEYEVAIELYESLKVKAPEVCTQKLHGRPYPNLTEFVSESYVKKEQQAIAKYFSETAHDNQKSPVDIKAGETLVNKLNAEIITNLSLVDLDPAEDDIEANMKICDYHIHINAEFLKLNDVDFQNVIAFSSQ